MGRGQTKKGAPSVVTQIPFKNLFTQQIGESWGLAATLKLLALLIANLAARYKRRLIYECVWGKIFKACYLGCERSVLDVVADSFEMRATYKRCLMDRSEMWYKIISNDIKVELISVLCLFIFFSLSNGLVRVNKPSEVHSKTYLFFLSTIVCTPLSSIWQLT